MSEVTILKPFLPLLKSDKRFRIAVGGRGSGKSQNIANIALVEAMRGKKILCCREFQNSTADSVHALLVAEIERQRLHGFTVTAKHITHSSGGLFIFKGLARNIASIKSTYGIDVVWVEEADTLSSQSIIQLTPTIREAGSYFLLGANPKSKADPFTQRFLARAERDLNTHGVYEDDLHLILKVNYDRNSQFPEELELERQFDEKTRSPAMYRHIWLGDTYDEVENNIIPVEHFDAAVGLADRHKVRPSGFVVLGHDPSDVGDDAKGYAVRHGSKILHLEIKTTGDVMEGVDRACELAHEYRADVLIYDADGLGLGLSRELDRQLGQRAIEVQKFHGGETPANPDALIDGHRTNRDAFANRRAQAWWDLRDRFYASYRLSQGEQVSHDECIFLPAEHPMIDQLRAEVCRQPRKHNSNGKFQLVSKPDMAKEPYRLPSPNLADALAYCFAAQSSVDVWAKPIEYPEIWGEAI